MESKPDAPLDYKDLLPVPVEREVKSEPPVVGNLSARHRYKGRNMTRLALLFGVTGLVFILSLLIGPMHYDGDQLHYTAAYNSVAGLGIVDAYDEYRRFIDSAEFVHFLIIWISSSSGLDKNLVMSAANGVLANVLVRLFLKWRVRGWVAVVFCFTNFYILVLYFTTERLKFSFIFVLLAALYWNHLPLRLAFSATAVFAHFQVLIGYAGVALSELRKSRLNMRLLPRQWAFVFFGAICFVVGCYMLGDFVGLHMVAKISFYSELNSKDQIVDSLVMVCFLVSALYYSCRRIEVVLVFSPIFVALNVIGSDRVNMIGYCVFSYYALKVSGGVNIAIGATSIYLMGKGAKYLYYLLSVGNGFGY